MKLSKVIGHVVSSVKTPSYERSKLMVVQQIDTEGNSTGDSLIAVDGVQSGIGDIVLVVEEGGSAREVMDNPEGAVDAIIVGIVDD